ncbi:MAG: AI-2E family transporter [Christensenellaceae bacterium]|nr:AI-2E family transporter [Christensenellaceae bacterium]
MGLLRSWKSALWVLGAAALLFAFRGAFSRLLLFLLVSATLAYLVEPLARRIPLKPGISALMAFLLVLLMLLGLLFLGVPALLRQLKGINESLPALLSAAASVAKGLKERAAAMGIGEELLAQIEAQLGAMLAGSAKAMAERALKWGNALADGSYMLLAPVVGYYMLRDKDRLFSWLQRLLPSRLRYRAMEVGLRVKTEIGAYVRGQILVSLISGAITALGLLLIGMPSWLVMGLIMVLCNMIPYFGPFLACIPILTFALPSGLMTALLALCVVLLAQQIENLVVGPRVLGEAAQLHPGVVIVVLLLGGWFFGFGGLLFSIPAALTLRAVLRAVQEARVRQFAREPAAGEQR